MLRERTAATAGDHIDWITTSPEAIRFTDWSNEVQNERNWPDRLMSIIVLMVLSISAFVMLPLLPYLMSPRASIAMATSMMPIVGLSCSADLPLNSELSRSAQEFTGRPTRSGRMPSVSPLVTVGMAVTYSVGEPSVTFWPVASVAYRIIIGVMPW